MTPDEDRQGWGPDGESAESHPLPSDGTRAAKLSKPAPQEKGANLATDDQARAQLSALTSRVVLIEAWKTPTDARLTSVETQVSVQDDRLDTIEADLSDHEARLIILEGGEPGGGLVDAGVDKTVVLPAGDLSLFARLTDDTAGPFTVVWSVDSGPGSVAFSASAALHTTATFTTPGSYVLRCAVDGATEDGSDTVTVTVRAATDATAFYVDPTYNGANGAPDGTAGRPWTTAIFTASANAAWGTINTALATNDVIVYFSARQAGADTVESVTTRLYVWRSDASAHRLILDGMSKYNANDSTPSWQDYAGSNRFRISNTTQGAAIGVDETTDGGLPMHYTTVRGFDCTGSSGRVTFAGNACVIEHVTVHDVTGLDPAILLRGAILGNGSGGGTETFGNLRDITIRNCTVNKCHGEGIYLAGNYIRVVDGGWPAWGNTHEDLLIENNVVRDAGFHGAQADGIDMKAGLRYVTIRGNLIDYPSAQPESSSRGLVSSGIFDQATTRSHLLIERNRFHRVRNLSLQQFNTVTFRNNIIAILASDPTNYGGFIVENVDDVARSKNLSFYGNTLFRCYIDLTFLDGATLRNNILGWDFVGGNVLQAHGSSTSIDSDYNFVPSEQSSVNWPGEGGHSVTNLSGATAFFVNPTAFDLHLQAAVAPINAGVSLAAGLKDYDTGFATDYEGTARPLGAAWDVGADEKA